MTPDPKPVVTLPRPDFPADDVRAWLFDGERRWLAALDCRDISARLGLEVCVHEHRDEHGRRKKGRKYAFGSGTPEQREREHAAGEMLEDRQAAMFATRRILVHVADLRHQSHAQETALVAHLTHAARTDVGGQSKARIVVADVPDIEVVVTREAFLNHPLINNKD